MNWNWIIWTVCGLSVVFNLGMCIRYAIKLRKVEDFHKELKRKTSTELELELATSDQLIRTLVSRPGNALIVITPKDENKLEVHVRNISPIGMCSLLATAQLIVLNQEPMESDEEYGR